MSIFFQNVDGNKSNFDALAVTLQRFNKKCPIIALAETNVCSEICYLYQLSEYTPKYQNKSKDKKKGSGVALYIRNSLNATVNDELSQVSENLETLFVTLSGYNPLTIGTLYRPPSGDLAMELDELSNILDKVPKQAHVAGDLNIDLHGSNSKNIQDYEYTILSKGFFPTIFFPTVTHEKLSSINNFITNIMESVIMSGTIPNSISNHFQIFKIFECSVNKSNCNAKHTQYYVYCKSNVEKFTNTIQLHYSADL